MEKTSHHGAVAFALGLFLSCSVGAGAQQTPPVTLPGHVLPALSQAKSLEVARKVVDADAGTPLSLTIVLRRSDEAGFQRYLHDVYDPTSPIFRKFLSPVEVSERLGPTSGDCQTVGEYFEQRGFALGESSANRMTLTINGMRDAAESALAVCSSVGGGATASNSGPGSPITVFGLNSGVPYVCTVTAANSAGPGTPSATSDSVSPFGSTAAASPIPTLDRLHALWLTLMLGVIAAALFRRGLARQRPDE